MAAPAHENRVAASVAHGCGRHHFKRDGMTQVTAVPQPDLIS